MANAEVGSAYLSIIPSMKGFGGKIAVGLTASMAAVGAACATMVKQATDAYSNYEQLTGGVEKLFGEASDTVMKNAQEAYASAGVSMNQYMDQINNFAASLKQSLGGDVQQAAELGNMAIHDMADNASVFGSNLQDVQNAYQGFAKQNYTMLDNLKLGYGGTKSEMERLIADANELEKAQGRAGDLSIEKFGDVIKAIHDVQEAQGIAGNSAEEASHTISGSIDSMKAAWENWLTALADPRGDVSGMTQKLIESVEHVVENLMPLVASISQNLAAALPSLISVVVPALANIFGAFFTGIDWGAIASSIASSLGQCISMAAGMLPAVPELANNIITQIQDGLSNAPIDFSGLIAQFDLLKGALDNAFSSIASTFEKVTSNSAIVDSLGGILSGAGQVIVAAITGIINIVAALLPAIEPILAMVLPTLSSGLTMLAGLINVVSGAVAGILGFIGPIAEFLLPIVAGIGAAVVAFNGVVAAISAFMAVGSVLSGLIGGISAAFGALNVVMALNPFGMIALAVIGLVTALTVLWNTNEGFRDAVLGAWQAVCDGCSTICSTIQSLWDGVGSFLSSLVQQIISFFAGIPDAISGFFSAAASAAQSAFQAAVSFFSSIPGQIIAFFNGVPSGISNFFQQAGQTVQNIWQGVSSFFSSLPGQIINFFSGIGSGISNFFQSAADTVRGIWDGIVNFFSGIPGQIEGFFAGMHIELPHIALPHFSISGSFSLDPPSIPHLSVEWYAKGGIFNSPSIIGVGEAGTEAVLPIDKLSDFIPPAEQVQQPDYADKLDAILNMLGLLLKKDTNAYMDTTKVSSVLAARSQTLAASRGWAL